MKLEEVGVVIDYFHGACAEHPETLGVDPTRLPEPSKWRQLHEYEFAQPVERRRSFMVLWELEGRQIGFSSVDKLTYGKEAHMHLHVIHPGRPSTSAHLAFMARHIREVQRQRHSRGADGLHQELSRNCPTWI